MGRNMHRIVAVVVLLAGALCLSACQQQAYIEDYTTDGSIEQEGTMPQDAADDYTFLREFNDRICTNYKGLFFIKIHEQDKNNSGKLNSKSPRIYFYDYQTGSSAIWCSNMACSHTDETCTAYVPAEEAYQFVEWASGYVYKLASDDAGMYVMRYNEDGTNEIKLVNLIKDMSGSVQVDVGRIYNNRLYYIVTDENENKNIYYADLLSPDTTRYLFSLEGKDCKMAATGMYINAQNIYVSAAKYSDGSADKRNYNRVIYQYSIADNEVKEIINMATYCRSCANDNLYYFTGGKKLFRVDAAGNTTEVSPGTFEVLSADDYSIVCNENYIVFDRGIVAGPLGQDTTIYIYDIRADKLYSVNEEMLKEESQEEQEESYTAIQWGADGSTSEVVIPRHAKFWGICGMSGRYCYVNTKSGLEVYAIDLASLKSDAVNIIKITY